MGKVPDGSLPLAFRVREVVAVGEDPPSCISSEGNVVVGVRISSVGANPGIASGRVVLGQTAGGGGQKTTSISCFEQGRVCGGVKRCVVSK